jgi:hypothetical protein
LDGLCSAGAIAAPDDLTGEARELEHVGIDFGGVIVRRGGQTARDDTSLASSDGTEIAQDGVFDAIREIVALCEGKVWIVSKARPHMQSRTRAWLEAVDFYSRTGMDPEHVRFCLEREDKEHICRELGLTHFIDDRVQLMQILRRAVPHLFLFGEQEDERLCPRWATFVSSWEETLEALRPSLSR